MDLRDKVAIVTGASSGLGVDFARLLVDRGATVYGFARRVDRLEEVGRALGGQFVGIACDITNEEAVATAVERVLEERDRIDVLINNAGLGKFGPIDVLSSADWSTMIDTNLTGVFYATRAVIPTMKQQNKSAGFGGHIVNIASVAGLLGNPNLGGYNATKFGLRGLSEAVMKEVRNDGIKVSCVFPGSVRTEFSDVAGTPGSPNPMESTDVAQTVIHLLETPDNYLISEVAMRPLRPRGT